MIHRIFLAASIFEKRAAEPQYAYHIKSKDFKGDTIFSLANLKTVHPDLFKKEMKKYKDRKELVDTEIEILKAKWKDCVMLSTIDPRKIFKALDVIGASGHEESKDSEIFRFNIQDLKDKKFCLYNDGAPEKQTSYSKSTTKNYRETEFVPEKTMKYFLKCVSTGEHPLIYSDINHLMVVGDLSVKLAEIIKY